MIRCSICGKTLWEDEETVLNGFVSVTSYHTDDHIICTECGNGQLHLFTQEELNDCSRR